MPLVVEATVFVLTESLMDCIPPQSVHRTKGEKLPICFNLLGYDIVWSSSGQQYFAGINSLYFQAEIDSENAITMESFILWNITRCSLLEVNQRFEGTYRLHLQGRKIIQERSQREIRW
jgi:hypothetical protein